MNLPLAEDDAAPDDQIAQALERFTRLHPKSIDLSLGRIERLLAALGRPERRLPPVIHVAGTNGKGSTVAFLRAMLEASGRSVHAYTSPHLVHFRERIRLAGTLVDDVALADAITRVEAANGDEPITFFEITTALAFLLFSERPADMLLLEVGLGGRLDATNVVDAPLVSVIAPVSRDHEGFLGSDVAGIAAEKAGIAKRGRPLVVGPQAEEAREAIRLAASRAGAPLFLQGEDWTTASEHGRLVYQDEDGLLDLPAPGLPGPHQIENAGLAVAALRRCGLSVPSRAIEEGLRSVRHPARLQRIASGALLDWAPEGAEIWLDGGHNPAAGVALSHAMAALEDRVARPLFLIVGMLRTKDPEGFLAPFADMARAALTVPVEASEASFSPAELAAAALEAGLPASASSGLGEALGKLRGDWQIEHPPRILICGSLYLAGAVLEMSGLAPA